VQKTWAGIAIRISIIQAAIQKVLREDFFSFSSQGEPRRIAIDSDVYV